MDKCEVLVKDIYVNLGMEYRETDSDSENSSSKPMEVIEIPDEDDDDVMSVDSGWRAGGIRPRLLKLYIHLLLPSQDGLKLCFDPFCLENAAFHFYFLSRSK